MDARGSLFICIAVVLLSTTPLSARADQTPTAGQLADVQAQTIMATAQAKLSKAREDAGSASASQDTSEPVVSGIGGSPGNLYVTFYNHGNVGYRIGMSTPGGYVVHSIALNEVRLRRAGRVVVLHLSATAPAAKERGKGEAATAPAMMSPFGSPITLPQPAAAGGAQ